MFDLAHISFVGTLPGWITAGGITAILGIVCKTWLGGAKLRLDSEGNIRDHYAKEVASLRAQLISVQSTAAAMLAAANQRYDEAITAADKRHSQCEEECERLRERVSDLSDEVAGLQLRMSAGHKATVRLFEPKSTLPREVKDQIEREGD
jgi:hypothetical protein